MVKRKRTKGQKDKQQYTKHYTATHGRSNRNPTKNMGVNSGAPERWSVPAPLVVSAVCILVMNETCKTLIVTGHFFFLIVRSL